MSIPGAVPAPMGRRLLAFVIDQVAGLLLGGAFVVAGLVPVVRSVPDAVASGAPLASVPPLAVLGCVLSLGFGLFQWWYQGARGFTVGKRLVGLRTLAEASGSPIGLGRALVRLLVPAAATLVLGVGQLVVYASPFFDRSGRRRGWHDKAAGSAVFDVAAGRDPAVVRDSSAPLAARRLEALLADRAAATFAPPPVVEQPPAAQEAPAHVAPAHVEPAHGEPMRQETVQQDPERAHAQPIWESLVPREAAATAREAGPGVIFSVPGARSTVEPVRPADVEPALPEPRPERRPPAAGRPAAAYDRTGPADAGLADDVERTRLRPARAKVPEVPAGSSQPAVAVDLTDGRRIEITGISLVGRRPAPRPEDGAVQLITVADPGRSVSKTHLAIGVDRAGVWIRDRDSTNGTVVTLADGQQILCAAEQQVRVPFGASVAFGDYGLTVAHEPVPARLGTE